MFRKVLINQFEIKDGAIIHYTDRGRVYPRQRNAKFSPNLDWRNWNW